MKFATTAVLAALSVAYAADQSPLVSSKSADASGSATDDLQPQFNPAQPIQLPSQQTNHAQPIQLPPQQTNHAQFLPPLIQSNSAQPPLPPQQQSAQHFIFANSPSTSNLHQGFAFGGMDLPKSVPKPNPQSPKGFAFSTDDDSPLPQSSMNSLPIFLDDKPNPFKADVPDLFDAPKGPSQIPIDSKSKSGSSKKKGGAIVASVPVWDAGDVPDEYFASPKKSGSRKDKQQVDTGKKIVNSPSPRPSKKSASGSKKAKPDALVRVKSDVPKEYLVEDARDNFSQSSSSSSGSNYSWEDSRSSKKNSSTRTTRSSDSKPRKGSYMSLWNKAPRNMAQYRKQTGDEAHYPKPAREERSKKSEKKSMDSSTISRSNKEKPTGRYTSIWYESQNKEHERQRVPKPVEPKTQETETSESHKRRRAEHLARKEKEAARDKKSSLKDKKERKKKSQSSSSSKNTVSSSQYRNEVRARRHGHDHKRKYSTATSSTDSESSTYSYSYSSTESTGGSYSYSTSS